MIFSKKVVLINTLIVIVPLFILLSIITVNSLRRQVLSSRRAAEDTVQINVSQINEKINTFNLIETMINANENIRMFFISPEGYTEDEVIDVLLTQTTILESISRITPYLYSTRLFPTNAIIPERWPMILQESRLTENDKQRWSLNYRANYMGYQNGLKLPSVCTTREIYKNHKLIGYLQIAVRMEDFFPSVYNPPHFDSYECVFKKTADNQLINISAQTDQFDAPKISKGALNKITKSICKSQKDSGTAFLTIWNKMIVWKYIPDLDVYLVHINLGKDLLKEMWIDSLLIILGIAALMLLLTVGVKYITNHLLSGFYTIMDGMKKVKEGDLSVQIPVSGIEEIQETQETFNLMTKTLTEQIEQIKTEQSLIADTEMKAMQNQINAHFLYNVLETIRMQAVLADQEDIEESLQVLGKMMRYCLRWRIHRVSLAQEIEYIKSYIYILNIRNDYTISLMIEIPEELMDLEIPKMTLQPLVENAFVHAIEATEADATLRITAKLTEDNSKVYLSVQDYGCGMDQETINKIESYLSNVDYERDSKGSIGLKNIQQRLNVFYGFDYKIQVESKLGEGTTISVPVPNVRSTV